MVNTILKEADLFCPNSVRINFTIYHFLINHKTCKRPEEESNHRYPCSEFGIVQTKPEDD
ncbi:hypothetical protein FIV30_13085 [Lactiplantibacillus plantarum]|nr:hypothetical protein [Lactiplantibacillus plantarum]